MKHVKKLRIAAGILALLIAITGCNSDAFGNVSLPSLSDSSYSDTPSEITDSEQSDASSQSDATTPATTTQTTTTTTATTTKKPPATTTTTTTTKPPATTTTTQTTTVAPKPVPTVEEITNRSIISYTYGVKNFKTSKIFVLYDFSDKKDSGVSRKSTTNPIRMHYGITASLNGRKISFSTYNDYPDVCKVSVTAIDVLSDTKTASVKVSDKTMTFDTSDYANGLYAIRAKFSYGKGIALLFYVNDGKTYLCSGQEMTDSELTAFKTRRSTTDKLLAKKNLTPDNCTDTSNLSYPHCDKYGNNSDTQEWMGLSFDITKPEWSDARKMFAIHEWMSENLAYDHYRADVLGMPRAFYYEDFSGTYDTWTNKAGVCHDFANIFATMCRAQGIPCNTLDNRGHTWNLVYVNGSWVEVDMTYDITNDVNGEDTTKWDTADTPYSYRGYADECVKGGEILAINDCLWDYAVFDGTKPVIGINY